MKSFNAQTCLSHSKSFITILGIICLLFITSGCPYVGIGKMALQGTKTTQIRVMGASYDEAFSKAVRTATEMGMTISSFDQAGGSFMAMSGNMVMTNITYLRFFLERSSQNSISAIVTIDSSQGDAVMNDFMSRYSQYVRVSY